MQHGKVEGNRGVGRGSVGKKWKKKGQREGIKSR